MLAMPWHAWLVHNFAASAKCMLSAWPPASWDSHSHCPAVTPCLLLCASIEMQTFLYSCNLIQQVLDDILALDKIDALQPLVCQVTVVTGLAKGDQQGWCCQHLFQS